MTGDEIITALNSSELIIDDDNIASTIARDSEVTSAIDTHISNATAHHDNSNDPTSDQKAALVGTSGDPSSSNKYVTDTDSRLTDTRDPNDHTHEVSDLTDISTVIS